MKRTIVLLALLAIPAAATAQNVGKCGWGSKLFDNQKGLIPQVLAVTTNGTFGNQTFAMSSGTSGCTQDGVVQSNWKTAMYIESNRTMLARDMSAGEGENLDTLANLIGVEGNDRVAFAQATQNNFAVIFPTSNTSTDEVLASLRNVLAANQDLAKYSVVL